jgi:hypothetical protein
VREVAKRLGFERTWLVRLPVGVKDVNEFLVHGGTREQFAALLAATLFDVPSILTMPQALDALDASGSSRCHRREAPSARRTAGASRSGTSCILADGLRGRPRGRPDPA